MSTTIDEKVVEMRFDNRQFEQNVQTSLGTIKELRQSLNLTGASKGLEGVSTAARRVDLSGISSAAETVGLKFSAMYTIADQALRNITNSAVNYGKRIVSALTIDPVKTGLSEYETQINAVQTILANTESKGTTLNDVNGALDELNTYADKTIYNFTEMTRNIGTFTAAGVDLDTSVKSIQGIANLAAVSGSTSQQASTAMYQLSQALAAGKVSLMDWNSVVNAGMGGQVFQDALKRTATVMGTDVDGLIKKYGSFRESLTKGEWLTSEVLTKTLEQFTMSAEEGTKQWEEYKKSLMDDGYTEEQAESILKMANTATNAATKVKTFTQLWDTLKETAQSGWTQTWEILVGDFEEAKETLSKVSDVLGDLINGMSEARNKMLQGWKDLGGRDILIEAISNAFKGLMNIVKPIGEAFREIFPALKPEQLLDFTKAIRDITETFKNAFNPELESGKKNIDNLKRTFKGLFAAVDIVRQILVAVVKAVFSLFGGVGELGGGILEVTAKIGDWLVKLRDALKTSDIFSKTLQKIVSVVKLVGSALAFLIKGFKDIVIGPGLELLYSLLKRIYTRMTDVGATTTNVKNIVVNAFEKMGDTLAGGSFFKFLKAVWDGIVTIGSGIAKAFGSLTGGLIEKVSNADFNGIIDLIDAIATGGVVLYLKKFADGFSDIFETIGSFKESALGILDSVRGCFEAYQTKLKAEALMQIAKAIVLLVAAVVVLSLVDSAKLSAALYSLTVLFTDMIIAMIAVSKFSGDITKVKKVTGAMISLSAAVLILSFALTNIATLSPEDLTKGIIGVAGLMAIVVAAAKVLGGKGKTVIKGATQMILFSAAIKILASVAKDLAALSWDELKRGLVGVGVLLAEVSLFMNTAKFSGKSVTTATGIVILASSLKILASACSDFAQMSGDELGKGLGSVGGVLAALITFTKLTSGSTNMISIGIGMIAIGAAMKIFASAVQDLGSMSWETIGKGLLTMAVSLTAIAIAVKFMPATMALTGIGFIAMAAGLLILSAALQSLGSMSWEGIAKSLVAIAGAFTVLCIGLLAMPLALPGAAALIVIASALLILTPVLMLLGNMSWESIAKGLVALAGAFTILGIAGAVLAPLVPSILGLAGAIALLGVGILGIGAGLLLAGAGLSAMAVGLASLAAAGAAGATSIVASLTVIITGIIGLIPAVIQKIGEGLIAVCGVIAEGAPAIGEAVASVCLSVIQAITKVLPPLMECLALIMDELLKFLIKYVPKIVDVGMKLILGLLEGIASHIGDIVKTALEIISNFIDGIAAGLPKIIQSGMNLMVQFVNGLANGIRKNTQPMINAVNNLMDAVMDAIAAYFKNAVSKGGELIDKLKSGIKDGIGGLKQAGKDAIQGFINGITSMLSSVGNAAKDIGSKALGKIKSVLGINSPSKEFMEVGEYSGEGLIKGLKSYSGKVANTAGGVGSTALSSIRSAMSDIADVINSDIDSNPTIRPVLDLSDVRSGAGAISNLLNSEQSIGALATAGAISSNMSQSGQNGTNDDVVSAIDKLRQDLGKVGGTNYNINGITYDDGSNVSEAIKSIVRAAKVERRSN